MNLAALLLIITRLLIFGEIDIPDLAISHGLSLNYQVIKANLFKDIHLIPKILIKDEFDVITRKLKIKRLYLFMLEGWLWVFIWYNKA